MSTNAATGFSGTCYSRIEEGVPGKARKLRLGYHKYFEENEET